MGITAFRPPGLAWVGIRTVCLNNPLFRPSPSRSPSRLHPEWPCL